MVSYLEVRLCSKQYFVQLHMFLLSLSAPHSNHKLHQSKTSASSVACTKFAHTSLSPCLVCCRPLLVQLHSTELHRCAVRGCARLRFCPRPSSITNNSRALPAFYMESYLPPLRSWSPAILPHRISTLLSFQYI